MYMYVAHVVITWLNYVWQHPGGPAPLKKHAGHDATALLCNTGLTDEVLAAVLLRFKVGYIDVSTFWQPQHRRFCFSTRDV